VGTWYVGKMASGTALVDPACTGAATCSPTSTPAVAVHLLLGGTRIATVRPPNLTAATAAFDEVLYYHRDYQGSVVATSRRGGGVDGLAGAKYRYTPYGQLDKADGVTALTDSELGYTGGVRLGWTAGVTPPLPQAPGLVLLGARVYHPELKRWLVPDTLDPLRYTYVGGDPVNFADPSGRARMAFPNKDMAQMYLDLFYGGSGGLSWNLAWSNLGTTVDPPMMGGMVEAVATAGDMAPPPTFDYNAYANSLTEPWEAFIDNEMAKAIAGEAAYYAGLQSKIMAQAIADYEAEGRAAFGALVGNIYIMNQDTGKFDGYHNGNGDEHFLDAKGFSGSNTYDGIMLGVNNHDAEPYPYIGPTPAGVYRTGLVDNSISVNTITLIPDVATQTYILSLSRDPTSFRIHGGNFTMYSGSEGCTVLPSGVRAIVAANPGTIFIYHSP
jgi:RHS repeat-associated protein